MELVPGLVNVETATHVLARRHVAASYRMIRSRLKKRGYVVNAKEVACLLKAWGFSRPAKKPTRRPRASRSTSRIRTWSGRPT